MRQFIYEPQHVGLSQWPSGTLRLDGIEVTEDYRVADVFVCPGSLRLFEQSSGVLDMRKLKELPHFEGNESRHVFFDVSDNFTMPTRLPIMFIRCDARSWMMPHDVNTIQMAWPVDDLGQCVEPPEDGLKYDIGFHGWVSSLVRRVSVESCLNTEGLKTDIEGHKDFYGYLRDIDPEQHRRRGNFLRSLKESRLQLCGESIEGVFPYRFWETLSAGRVPLLIGSDFVYPFADEIDYDQFTVKCPRIDAPAAGQIALDFVRGRTDEEILAMGKLARAAWVKFCDSRNWPQLHAYAVQKKLGVLVA